MAVRVALLPRENTHNYYFILLRVTGGNVGTSVDGNGHAGCEASLQVPSVLIHYNFHDCDPNIIRLEHEQSMDVGKGASPIYSTKF